MFGGNFLSRLQKNEKKIAKLEDRPRERAGDRAVAGRAGPCQAGDRVAIQCGHDDIHHARI